MYDAKCQVEESATSKIFHMVKAVPKANVLWHQETLPNQAPVPGKLAEPMKAVDDAINIVHQMANLLYQKILASICIFSLK